MNYDSNYLLFDYNFFHRWFQRRCFYYFWIYAGKFVASWSIHLITWNYLGLLWIMTLIIFYLIITFFIVDFKDNVSTILESVGKFVASWSIHLITSNYLIWIMTRIVYYFVTFFMVDFKDDVSTIFESMPENSLHHGVFI